jgi:hypothetical protein
MVPRLVQATYLDDYRIHLRFADGTQGEVDLGAELYGELLEPLKNKALFRQFTIHPEFQTLTWANGADIAPEFLFEKLRLPV